MLIRYFLENTEYANRTRDNIPRKGDYVRFKGIPYLVQDVEWVEDEQREVVHINLK